MLTIYNYSTVYTDDGEYAEPILIQGLLSINRAVNGDSVAIEMLRSGRNVIVEFGSWSKSERDALRDAAREVGADVELRYVTAPIDELWQRITDRGTGSQFGARSVREDELAAWASWFEVPTVDEFAQYDRPFDAPD